MNKFRFFFVLIIIALIFESCSTMLGLSITDKAQIIKDDNYDTTYKLRYYGKSFAFLPTEGKITYLPSTGNKFICVIIQSDNNEQPYSIDLNKIIVSTDAANSFYPCYSKSLVDMKLSFGSTLHENKSNQNDVIPFMLKLPKDKNIYIYLWYLIPMSEIPTIVSINEHSINLEEATKKL